MPANLNVQNSSPNLRPAQQNKQAPTADGEHSLYMVRHIPTKLNEGGKTAERSRGWGPFPPDPEQLKKLAPDIANELSDKNIARIVSSDLPRAAISAKAIGSILGIPVHTTPQLRTWNTGDMNGKSEDEVKPKKLALIKHSNIPAPGGESFDNFTSRWGQSLRVLMKHNEQNPDDQIAAVIHGNMDMSADSISRGEPVTAEHYEKMRPPGAISVLKWSANKPPQVYAYGDDGYESSGSKASPESTTAKQSKRVLQGG